MENTSSSPKTTIRRADLSDKEQIWSFIKTAYKEQHPDIMLEQWIWQYQNNPSLEKKDAKLPVWIAEKDNKIVGQIAGIPVELKIGSQPFKAVWGVDLVVLPDCRGEGVGRRLIEAMVLDYGQYMAVGMSDITTRIYERINYVDIGSVSVMRKIIKIGTPLTSEYLEKFSIRYPIFKWPIIALRHSLLIRPTTLFLNTINRLRIIPTDKTSKAHKLDIVEVNRFGKEIEELWEKYNQQYGIIVKRDRSYLNWRFFENKQFQYRAFYAMQNEHLKGYIVLRKPQKIERNIGYIADLFCGKDDQDALEALIRHGISFFGKEVELIECTCSHESYIRVLRRFGFLQMSGHIPYAYSTDPSINKQIQFLKNDWFITASDSDLDRIRPRRKP